MHILERFRWARGVLSDMFYVRDRLELLSIALVVGSTVIAVELEKDGGGWFLPQMALIVLVSTLAVRFVSRVAEAEEWRVGLLPLIRELKAVDAEPGKQLSPEQYQELLELRRERGTHAGNRFFVIEKLQAATEKGLRPRESHEILRSFKRSPFNEGVIPAAKRAKCLIENKRMSQEEACASESITPKTYRKWVAAGMPDK